MTAGMPAARLADLVEGTLDEAFVADLAAITPHVAPAVAVDAAAGSSRTEILHSRSPSQSMQRERGERVVHRRRQRPDRDLHELIDGEREVLGEGPVGAGDVGLLERAGDLGGGAGGHTAASGSPSTRKWPGR